VQMALVPDSWGQLQHAKLTTTVRKPRMQQHIGSRRTTCRRGRVATRPRNLNLSLLVSSPLVVTFLVGFSLSGIRYQLCMRLHLQVLARTKCPLLCDAVLEALHLELLTVSSFSVCVCFQIQAD
jgi:hypothetical protein